MPYTFARAVLASAIALGTLVFSAGSAVPASSSSGTTMFAPLWVYPPAPRVQPPVTIVTPEKTTSLQIIREEPSLLTPADLHFSVEKEGDVTVVRGPIAR
ncbi:MAG TPA: hypothetical protein VJS41_09045 [Stellaceae bacterium]|nr:hypothetical protein [Stellaceae bacterium]